MGRRRPPFFISSVVGGVRSGQETLPRRHFLSGGMGWRWAVQPGFPPSLIRSGQPPLRARPHVLYASKNDIAVWGT